MAIVNKVQQAKIYSSIEEKTIKKNGDDFVVSKKRGNFLTTTIDELRKVNWPSFTHVLKWSMVTIIFCVVLGSLLSYVDRVFSSSIIYSDCVVKVNKGKSSDKISDCNETFAKKLLLR